MAEGPAPLFVGETLAMWNGNGMEEAPIAGSVSQQSLSRVSVESQQSQMLVDWMHLDRSLLQDKWNRWKKSQALLGKSRFINYKAWEYWEPDTDSEDPHRMGHETSGTIRNRQIYDTMRHESMKNPPQADDPRSNQDMCVCPGRKDKYGK